VLLMKDWMFLLMLLQQFLLWLLKMQMLLL